MKEFVAFRAKTSAYLMDDDTGHKKRKRNKNVMIKRRLMFGNYTDCLVNDKIILKSEHRFKREYHNVMYWTNQ